MRLWTLDEIFRRWPGLGFRIAFETALPSLAALTWGAKSFLAFGGTLFGAITSAGLAFTAVLYVQGQVLRMAKNVRDERDADEFRDSFASIQQALHALQGQKEAIISSTPEQRNALEIGGYFFEEARQALKHGLNYAAATLGAIGFEGAARHCAEFVGVNAQLPLTAILRELASLGWNPPLLEERFRTLARVRNSIVHTKPASLTISGEQARQLVEGFLQGARDLENIEQAHL